MNPKHIVIVGGGTAGLMLATRLGNTLGRAGEARISLVDRSLTHIWKPMLHTIAAGTRDVHQQQVNYLGHARSHHFHYEPGELLGLDRAGKTAQLAPILGPNGETVVEARSLAYDAVVLALGSGANDFGTPGVADHCHLIDSQAQAESFNAALRLQLLRAAVRDEEVKLAIVGAGATGVELAAEVSHLMEQAAAYGDPAMRERLRLRLYESGPRVLGAFAENVAEASQRQLSRLGFEVRTGTKVSGAQAGGLQVGGQLDAADLMVWAAGVKAPPVLAGIEGLATSRSGQVLVREDLQADGGDGVFAIGDCSSMTPAGAERPLPPTAQVAAQQSDHLARHLPGWLRGMPVPRFEFRDKGALVSLGKYNAYGTLGTSGLWAGHFIRGRLAQLGHAWLYRRHQVHLHGWGSASLLWLAECAQAVVRPAIRLN